MESVDIIKLLKEEQKEQDSARTNGAEEKDLTTMFGYYDKFVKPKIDKLVSQGKLKDDEIKNYPFVMHIIQLFLTIENGLFNIDEEDFYIYPFLFPYFNRKGNDNLNVLLTKDKDFKNEVATSICEVLLIRQKTKCVSAYFKGYIEPLLSELNSQGKIIYNMLSNDNVVLEISQKIKTIVSSFLGIISSELVLNNDEEIPKDNLLYNVFMTDDNIELKKELSKGICEDFLNFYKENDFKTLNIDELQEKLNQSLFVEKN